MQEQFQEKCPGLLPHPSPVVHIYEGAAHNLPDTAAQHAAETILSTAQSVTEVHRSLCIIYIAPFC
jgi:hypothetical protein